MTVPISSSQIFKASLHYGQCTASCKTGHKGMLGEQNYEKSVLGDHQEVS